MDIQTAWENVEKTVGQIESEGPAPHLIETMAAAIYLLMDYPANEILARVDSSPLPTRPTASWLIFEAGRIKQVDPARVRDLREAWENNYSHLGEVIPPHPAMCG